MDYHNFYRQLFAPLESSLGRIDRDTIVAILGFDMGGPLNFCTIGRDSDRPCRTYVSCELAVREAQQPSAIGRYELLVSCDDERWVRSIVTDIGRMSFEVAFAHGHTLDIGPWVDPDAPIQGIVFEDVSTCRIDGQPYGILRVIGISRHEMEYAQEYGVPTLIARLKTAGVYPETRVFRDSVI